MIKVISPVLGVRRIHERCSGRRIGFAGRVPFGVGGSGGHGSHGGGFGLMEFIVLLLVSVGGGFYFLHRRKSKQLADKS